MSDPEDFIRRNLPAVPVQDVPEILLHTANAASRLGSFAGGPAAPYWAYPWAGGVTLARFIFDRPETVRGRAVADMGAGSGLVAIAAMKAGASSVVAYESDAVGRVTARLNARLNGVSIDVPEEGAGDIPGADIILAGDVFYDEHVGAGMAALFDRIAGNRPVLIGDPFRRALPLDSLELLAEYSVSDFGSGSGKVHAGVFRWRPRR